MLVDTLWHKNGLWTNAESEEGKSECYYVITPYGDRKAEFCDNGNIKIMIYNLDMMNKTNPQINLPSREDVELFYTYNANIYSYIPVLFNGRLI